MTNYKDLKILAIIPARGGSKAIPRKNIIKVAGKPLLHYTTNAAIESKFINRIILSTDDDKIARLGKQLGVEVPFIRPSKFAQDNTPTTEVIKHTLDFLKNNEDYSPDLIILLQPTSPLRKVLHIDDAFSNALPNPTLTQLLCVTSKYSETFVSSESK